MADKITIKLHRCGIIAKRQAAIPEHAAARPPVKMADGKCNLVRHARASPLSCHHKAGEACPARARVPREDKGPGVSLDIGRHDPRGLSRAAAVLTPADRRFLTLVS